MKKKIRIEFEDDEGTKYTLALEGSVSRDKILKAVDMLEVMDVPIDRNIEKPPSEGTFYGKVMTLIENGFSTAEFSSSDVTREFDERYNQPVRLSTVSTYLSRLAEKGYLRRERFGNSWVYRRVYLKGNQVAER
ncbi:MAG: BlaI/MecI/CopY family transcriptional regulator [Nitrososphaerales archaeon]|nr:BlaI/MecI/CopY family transcriptional regulator [Nitrososphaerales archaeon]